LNNGDFKDLVIRVLIELGYDVFESDKCDPGKGDRFILESHKAEKHRWHVKSWSLFQCSNQAKLLNSEDIKNFYNLVLSDSAEYGYVITTSSFTVDAKAFVKDKPIELIDGKEFLSLTLKASSSGNYCNQCLEIPTSVRASLKNLRARIGALNRVEHQASGKWTAPFNLDLILGDIIRKIKTCFKNASKLEKKHLETKLVIGINSIISSVARMTREIESFEKLIQEFSKKKKDA
jgi:hypothetical protein